MGTLGIEKRLKGAALAEAMEKSRKAMPDGNAVQAALAVLRKNPQAREFFIFVFVAIFSIFLQDNILAVSYTHLDVYKRQAKRSPALRALQNVAHC